MFDEGKPLTRVEIQDVAMNVSIAAPLHLHPCPTLGVVKEGRIIFEIEGEQKQHLEVGDTFYEPAGVRVAKFNNDEDTPPRNLLCSIYLVKMKKKRFVYLNKNRNTDQVAPADS